MVARLGATRAPLFKPVFLGRWTRHVLDTELHALPITHTT
ncbi:hypothetical protein M3J09_008038 [Ascochyta lentis]